MFNDWLAATAPRFGLEAKSLQMASADASFRRYFRVNDTHGQSFVIMDAPPDKENSAPFVAIAQLLAQAGIRGPKVLDWQQASGFLLLTDLGQRTLLECLDAEQPSANLPAFNQATDLLVKWQLSSKAGVLPDYNEALLMRELHLFDEWYLGAHKGLVLNDTQKSMLVKTYQTIIANNLSSSQVYVHRDYMPRNLMVSDVSPLELGILDFQDAVYGPFTYDIASLCRDAFWTWEEDFVLDVTIRYWEKARKAGLPLPQDFGDFYRAVDWMALQRHLKVAGIFARLTLRDGKPKYLADTPRFIAYIRQTAGRYRELTPLLRLVDQVEGLQAMSGFAYGRM
jgi:aminoglycoside/choline kinase family phosphotransferase